MHYFIIGGTGSLGRKLVDRYLSQDSHVTVYSRDECKQWELKCELKNRDVSYEGTFNAILGDIRDKDRLEQCLIRENPNVIIIASALKHVDVCEVSATECIKTNITGTMNVLDVVESNIGKLSKLSCVCLISTDKACSPVNLYGMCKAASEQLVIERSLYIPNIKMVSVRYGNVLNSRGSIIPTLKILGEDERVKEFTLTHPDMTRFVMTLEESVNLINYAIQYGQNGDVVIPHLRSMKLEDLFQIFSRRYNKTYRVTQMRPGEKIDEYLINETQSLRVRTHNTNGVKYYLISSPHSYNLSKSNPTGNIFEYHSGQEDSLISQEELEKYLDKCGML